MKKFFSAILLMTMMVFSVGTFVSCNDLVNEIEGVKGQATELEAAVDALEAEIATLETKLQAAQSAADDAMAAAKAAQKTGDEAKVLAEAAKAAAADAEAKAIAKAKEEVAALKTELEAAIDKKADKTYVDELVKAANDAITKLQGDVKTLEEKLATYEDTLKTFKENLEKLGALTEELEERIDYNLQAITNLQGAVDNHEMRIEDLEAAVAKIEKAMKEMDNNLIKAIAGQIQSIVYVPETTAGTIVAKGFDYSASVAKAEDKPLAKSIVFSATYEVMPKELASTITVDNASLVTVATKAAAAVECTVVSVVADDATGRVVVNARIAGGSDAYKSLIGTTGGAAVALRVSQANPVEVDENTTEDLGTYVSSAYTNVTLANKGSFDDVYDNFVFVDADDKLVGTAFDNTAKPYEVSYNWVGLEKAKVNLFPFEVAFEMLSATENGGKAKNVTPAEATALIGTNLAVTYVDKNDKGVVTVAPTFYDKDDNVIPAKDAQNKAIVPPILVSGTDLSATATLQVSNKDAYKGVNSIGAYAILELGDFYANKQPINLSAKAKYSIVKGTAVDNEVVIDKYTHNWTYGQAKNATTLTAIDELAVSMPDALTHGDVKKLFTYNTATEKYTPIEFTAKWGTQQNPKSATAKVIPLSKTAVEITEIEGSKLEFAATDQTYTFEAEVEDPATQTTYPISFEVTLTAMPAELPITLPEISLYTGSEMVKEISVLSKIVDHIKAKDNTFSIAYFLTNTIAERTLKGKVDGTPVDDVIKLNLAAVSKNVVVEESKLSVVSAKLPDYKNTITFEDKITVCGVDVKINGTVNTLEPTFTFGVNTVNAPGNVATVTGTYTINEEKTATTRVVNSSTQFALDQIDLRSLVVVDLADGLVEDDFRLSYQIVTDSGITDEDGKPLNKKPYQFCNPYTTLAAPTTNNPVNLLNWQYEWTELDVKISLVSKASAESDNTKADFEKDVVFASETITIKMDDLVNLSVANPVRAQYSQTSEVTASIASALVVTDANTNAPLYNPYAADLTEIWAGYTETLKAGVVTGGKTLNIKANPAFAHVFDVFGQQVLAPEKDKDGKSLIKVYYNGELLADPAQMVTYTYDAKAGTITMAPTNIDKGEVKFVVPVTLVHKYDDYKTHTHAVEAEVIFSSEAVEDDNTVENNFPTPSGQWLVKDGGMANSGKELDNVDPAVWNPTDRTYDFGNITLSASANTPACEKHFGMYDYQKADYYFPVIKDWDKTTGAPIISGYNLAKKAGNWYIAGLPCKCVFEATSETTGYIYLYTMVPGTTSWEVLDPETADSVMGYKNYVAGKSLTLILDIDEPESATEMTFVAEKDMVKVAELYQEPIAQ